MNVIKLNIKLLSQLLNCSSCFEQYILVFAWYSWTILRRNLAKFFDMLLNESNFTPQKKGSLCNFAWIFLVIYQSSTWFFYMAVCIQEFLVFSHCHIFHKPIVYQKRVIQPHTYISDVYQLHTLPEKCIFVFFDMENNFLVDYVNFSWVPLTYWQHGHFYRIDFVNWDI